jgi:hypothetical protein
MLVFVTTVSLPITGIQVQFWLGNRKEKGQLEDLIVERIILKRILKSIWGGGELGNAFIGKKWRVLANA